MQRGDVHWLSKPNSQVRQSLNPIRGPGRFLHRVIVTVHPRIILLHLQPTTGLEVVERLAVELRPTGRAAAQRSPVYEVELRLSKLPRLFEVVDVEFEILRYVARLDG
jgi:hypothetical protein